MKFKFLKTVLVGLLLSISCLFSVANAGLISLGSLERSDTDNTVKDTVSGLEWSLWDYDDQLTRTQLDTELMLGGDWYGYRVANSTDVFQLLNNAGWIHPYTTAECLDANPLTVCHAPDELQVYENSIFNQKLHELFFNVEYAYSYTYDYMMWDTTEYGNEAKDIGIFAFIANTKVRIFNDWHTYKVANIFTEKKVGSGAMRYALIKNEVNMVPEPSTFAIFLLGVIGLASRRSKKKS